MCPLVRVCCFLLLVELAQCMKAGDCFVDVTFNSDVDLEKESEENGKLALLLTSYRVTSPFQCIKDCCETEMCSAITYIMMSDSNCNHYSCIDFTCPTKSSNGRYVYQLHPALKTTITIDAEKDMDDDLKSGSGRGQQIAVTPLHMATLLPISRSATSTIAVSRKTTAAAAAAKTKASTTTTTSTVSPTSRKDVTTISRFTSSKIALETTKPLARSTNLEGDSMQSTKESVSITTFKQTYGLLVTFAVFGFVILSATIYVVSSRLNQSLKNYRYGTRAKVEYLINDRRMFA